MRMCQAIIVLPASWPSGSTCTMHLSYHAPTTLNA